MILYRSVNKDELNLIVKSDWKRFPPRTRWQPIFYPVLTTSYVEKINRWNMRSYGRGYVLKFEIDDDYINDFEVHNVGDKEDNEYWILAKELENFNDNLIGNIVII